MSDPLLLTLDEAKLQLNITSVDDDALITLKIASSSASICLYLKDATDQTWDPATTPADVKEAASLLLVHRFEHRGDNFGDDNDPKVWAAIGLLLAQRRTPALA